MMVLAAGHYKETKIQTTIQGAILLLGGILFTGIFGGGIYGVVFAAILSNAYRALDFILYVDRHIVKGSARKTLFNMAICTCVIIIVCLLFRFLPLPHYTAIQWVLKAFLVAAVAFSLELVFAALFQKQHLFRTFEKIKMLFIK